MALACAAGVVAAAPRPVPAADAAMVTVPLDALEGRLQASPGVRRTPAGVEVAVDGHEYLVLPFAAVAVELDVDSQGPVLLTWASLTDGRVSRFGPPWRYRRLPDGRSSLRVDQLLTAGWTPRSQPVLFLEGAGRVVIRAIRFQRPWPEAERDREEYDAARRWAADSTAHTTINFLSPSYWSASRGTWFADVAAGVGVAALVATLALGWARGRRARGAAANLRLAVAVGALAAFAAWDVQFAIRYLPMTDLAIQADPEVRIRDDYYFRPELGALAALARKALAPGDRVEVRASERDWFAGQTMCFNLAPRRCVFANPGTGLRRGISGVGRLDDGEIDAVVTIRSGPLPPGFTEVGAVSPTLLVGRRR